MDQSVLSQIENGFSQLSISEQLWLIERLVHRAHQSTLRERNDLDSQLALMAADPEIQSELQNIEREFAYSEADGLEAIRCLLFLKIPKHNESFGDGSNFL